MHLLWVEVARAREEQLLRALREVQGFRTVELTESDLTQTWFRVSLPDREHILETAIEVLLSIEGFSVEIQGAMHGPIIAIVFNAVPGQTTRPRLLRRQYDRRLLHDRVSVPVSPPWALPVPPQGAPPSARPEQPGPAPPVAVPTARPRAVRRGGLGRAVQRIEDLAAERGDTQGFPRPGLWRAATQPARRALGSPRVSRVIATAIPALLVLLTVYQATLRRVFEGGPFPSSTDAMGHLYRVSYLAQEWKHWRLIPQWTPGWYMGTPLTEFYPPLVTFVMAPMAALADPALSYRVFVFVAVALAAVLTAVLFRSRLGSAGAASAGILYGLAPFVLRTVFSGGALPLALFIAIQPVLLWLLLELYRRPSATRFILAALGSAMLVLTDNQQALMLFACVGVGVAVAASVFRRRLERPAQVLAAMTVGVLLAAVWLLPAMASLDFDDTPNRGGPERPFVHSRDFSVMSPGTRTRPHDAYLGLALLALAGAGAAVARRRPFSTLLVATTGVAVFFMFGMNNPIISGVWVLQQFVFFERFLLVASLTLALLAGLLVQTVAAWLPTRVRLPLPGVLIAVAVLAVGLVDARPYFQLVRATDHDLWVASSETLDRSAPPGRLADFIGRPELSYFPATVGRDALYGWSIEGTPHAANIARLGEAIGAGHGRFVDRQLRQWWVAGAYALTDDPFASPALQTAGFAPGPAVDRGVRVTPWTRQDTASIASALTRNAVVVGRAHRQTEIVFPWANQTRTGDYAELTDDVLRDNDIIVLAEAPSSVPDAVQSRLTAFQRRGGVIIALIGNDPAVWRADVRLKRQTFSPIMTVIDRSGRVLESPVEVNG
ncbi:MAG: hypothetical protein HQ548_07735, partial [Chloroflexi bacterium]|nr:hypothetical protein [Chloroflexota bacterium]